jgi:prepilin-type N-terminal cleavage/methylation domain-containing protein
MSVELGAWSVEPAGRRSRWWRVASGGWRVREGGGRQGTVARRQETGNRGRRSRRWRVAGGAWRGREGGRRASGAFTLVEVLVTVALIAVMATLLTPAVRGLMGVAGPRGGVNVLSSAVEQARLSAMESGQATYVGFPFSAGSLDEETRYSSVIVFRDARDDEDGDHIPISRWLRMPQGVYIETSDLGDTENPGGAVPKLNGQQTGALSVLKFDRFGKLFEEQPVVIRVGQKAKPTEGFMGGDNQHFEVTVQPLTGRAMVLDKAREGK